MARIKGKKQVKIEDLKPYANNAKQHGEEQIRKIADSIREFGFISPCLIDTDGNVIAGHGRILAAQQIGMKTVPCVYVEGLTEDQRRAYILADNRLTELGEWDMDLVSEELEALKEHGFDINLTGFDIDDITENDIDFTEIDSVGIDDEEDPEEQPRTKLGELYRLGKHLLLCGDATELEDVQRVLQGDQADCVITDPPYNVNLGDYKSQEEAKRLHRRTDGKVIENDEMSDEEYSLFLDKSFTNIRVSLREGGCYYIWHASQYTGLIQEALDRNQLKRAQTLVWVKNTFPLSRQDYHWRHEPCQYGWKEGAAHYFVDNRTLTTVFNKKIDIDNIPEEEARGILRYFYSQLQTTAIFEDKPLRSEEHPTMKPVRLIEQQVRNSTRPGEIVLDPFGGSGTTLIACEELERSCRMIEKDPHYMDVIIDRWEALTGRKAERIA